MMRTSNRGALALVGLMMAGFVAVAVTNPPAARTAGPGLGLSTRG